MSKPIQIIRNPFDGDQFFETEILAGQQEVLTSQKNSLLNFKKTYFNHQTSTNLLNNFFMSIQENYLKTIHFITKNAIVATILMLLALTTVSASAAELLAPTEFKPSTILNLKPSQTQTPNPTAQTPSYQVPNDWKTVNFSNYSFRIPADLEYKPVFYEDNKPTILVGKEVILETSFAPRILEVRTEKSDIRFTCFDENGNEQTISKEKEVQLPNHTFNFVSKGINMAEHYGTSNPKYTCIKSDAYSISINPDEYVIFDFNKSYARVEERELSEQEKMTILNSLTTTTKSSASSQSSSVQASSQTNSSATNQAKLIYTNPSIPNFKPDYTGWTLKESKEKLVLGDGSNQDPRSEKITLIFSKAQSTLKFEIDTYSVGGIPGPVKKSLEETNISSGNVKTTRIKVSDSTWLYGHPGTGLVPALDYGKNDGLAAFFWTIEYTGSNSLLPEVDKIVLNSGLKF